MTLVQTNYINSQRYSQSRIFRISMRLEYWPRPVLGTISRSDNDINCSIPKCSINCSLTYIKQLNTSCNNQKLNVYCICNYQTSECLVISCCRFCILHDKLAEHTQAAPSVQPKPRETEPDQKLINNHKSHKSPDRKSNK